jgi:hypothetical protein
MAPQAREQGFAGQRFAASWGLWYVEHHQSRLDHARQLAEELIGLGEASQDPGLRFLGDAKLKATGCHKKEKNPRQSTRLGVY